MQEQMRKVDDEIKHLNDELVRTAAERDQALDELKNIKGLKKDLNSAKEAEAEARKLSSEAQTRIQELERELKRTKESEERIRNSLNEQAKQFGETNLLLEDKKHEAVSLQQKLEKLENLPKHKDANGSSDDNLGLKQELKKLESELSEAKENLSHAKIELKLALDAEEHSKKAMDDLALALRDVAIESHNAKEELVLIEAKLKNSNEEREKYKKLWDETQKLLDEARKEAEFRKTTLERLKLEAEESLLASNDKETGFIECIKRADEEKLAAQEENTKLHEMLEEAEALNQKSKEENNNLRDILKQALNEANAAKDAANIARHENSQLKDSLKEKDEHLRCLLQENECFKTNEVAFLENINELKRMLLEASSNNSNTEDEAEMHKLERQNGTHEVSESNKHDEKSSNPKELKICSKEKDENEKRSQDKDPENSDPQKGSLCDIEPSSPTATGHHRRKSSCMLERHDGALSSEDLENSKKRKPLKRFEALVKWRVFYRKEASQSPTAGETITHS